MAKKVATSIPAPPPKLVEALKHERCALFVGAGLSQGAGLPGWKDLLEEVIARTDVNAYGLRLSTKQKSEMRKLIKLGRYLDVAQELSDILTRPEFLKELVDILKPYESKAQLTEAHKELPELPFSLAITTNYDRLLERAYSAARGGDTPPIYTHKDPEDFPRTFYERQFFILKAHGTIDQQSNLILTHRDYRQTIRGLFGYKLLLAAVFATRTVFFVGASLQDPELTLLLDEINDAFQGRGPENYALMPAREVGDVAANRWSKDYNVKCLRYDATPGHPEVAEFLRRLRAAI